MVGSVRYGVASLALKTALAIGFATLPLQAAADELVMLGDSLTQGYGLPQGEGLVPTLDAWLTDRGHDVEVINAGVSGDTSAGGLSRVGWSLSDETSALVVALGGNDLLRGIAPGEVRANIDGILSAASERGIPVLLVGIAAPGNYGAGYQQAFDTIWPDLSQKYGALLYPDIFAALRGDDEAAAARRFMQSDGIHPNPDGVDRIVEELGPLVEDLLERAES